ncbi:RNA polymerase factor sigma-54 [Wenzhouxiangella sp. XN24]|uniref:RNA polymerase factor sigma-54 n=1 Tax=Wenzhouxiangella sp. XN24 TaxID=2713569 RepID=UPI0013EBED5E|nr:RNA polymerase factor sigma-54 [Wenzhouxiangella sp. XN24]NGX15195.1 RNA polymerase factor sigma-54 [Wenzhouxiangella sp. XN24]
MMKQSLQLKLGQQLTLTPQLQMAIRLLQLPVLDLQAELREALEKNVMLEMDDGLELAPAKGEQKTPSDALRETPAAQSAESGTDTPERFDDDVSYADVSDFGSGYSGSGQGRGDGEDQRDYADVSGSSLRDHLIAQLDVAFPEGDRKYIATMLVDAIDDDGYLTESLEDICTNLAPELVTDVDEVERVLACVQRFDPLGVGARDLSECLLLQLAPFAPDTPDLELVRRLASECLVELGEQDYATIRRRLGCSVEQLEHAVALLRSLNPRPGGAADTRPPEYIVPDVFVRRDESGWRVDVNPAIAPRLRVNAAYAGSLGRGGEYSTLRTQLQEARWLVKSLEIRNETLIRVARAIVSHQEQFLERGEEGMRPLVLREIADALELHESTVSRATTGKYMHTPRGVYEFRYFFSSQVSGSDGESISSTAIRARIRKLIAEEDPAKPLSDSALTRALVQEGIEVARRTVAKYRESMGFPSSNERRRVTIR